MFYQQESIFYLLLPAHLSPRPPTPPHQLHLPLPPLARTNPLLLLYHYPLTVPNSPPDA